MRPDRPRQGETQTANRRQQLGYHPEPKEKIGRRTGEASMKIYTSSWFEPLPATIQKIGISRGTPRGYPAGYRVMSELAPGPWFKSVSPAEYHRRYMEQLADLSVAAVLTKLDLLGKGGDVALLCFEKPRVPADWCHRGQVAGWLWDQARIEVFEFGLDGCGWQHPKLLPTFRK